MTNFEPSALNVYLVMHILGFIPTIASTYKHVFEGAESRSDRIAQHIVMVLLLLCWPLLAVGTFCLASYRLITRKVEDPDGDDAKKFYPIGSVIQIQVIAGGAERQLDGAFGIVKENGIDIFDEGGNRLGFDTKPSILHAGGIWAHPDGAHIDITV